MRIRVKKKARLSGPLIDRLVDYRDQGVLL